MKSTAVSYPNIAFNKYWGNYDETLRLPYNNTISMNLEGLTTKTTVEFSRHYKKDIVVLNGKEIDAVRAKMPLDYIRKIADINSKAKIVSENDFPTGTGMASSASAYSALALAGCSALELKLSEREISTIARLGSGSACRSIPGGFSEWIAGASHETSYAYQLAPPEHMDILDIIAVVQAAEKKVSSTKGHKLFETSPFKPIRLAEEHQNLIRIRESIINKDFKTFGEFLEKDAIEMHVTAMTSRERVFYWNGLTLDIMKEIRELRENGIEAYCTTDAGPNVHIITQPKFKGEVEDMLNSFFINSDQIFVCKPAGKPYLTKEHLF